jgi:hypothetical protein
LYKQAENQLLNELIACSPRVSAQQVGVFLLDASGLHRLGGENKFCRELLRRASQCGYVYGQVGIADSGWLIVSSGGDQAFLAQLSINHLPLSPELSELFQELGIRTMGQVADLPADSLVGRFGKEGGFIHELVRGIDDSQPRLPPIERKFEASIEIGGPIESLNDTLFLFKAMLDRLTADLKQQMICADELIVSFYNDNDRFDERKIPLIRPSNSAKFLVEVIKLTLEAKPLEREFTGLKVAVSSYCKESWEQPQFDVNENACGARMQSETAMLLLQRFRARLGDNALLVPVARDDYFAEKAGAWVPVLKSKSDSITGWDAIVDEVRSPGEAPDTVQPVPVNSDYVVSRTGEPGLTSPLVMRRVVPPEQVLVRLDRGSQPIAITHSGVWHKVIRITAPDCLSGHWWERSIRKSYYVALIERPNSDQSALVSLVHEEGANAWFVEAVYD